MAEKNPAKIARTAANKARKLARHAIRMLKQEQKGPRKLNLQDAFQREVRKQEKMGDVKGIHITPTAMRQAFDAIIVKPSAATQEGKRIAGIISDKMHENKGMIGYNKRKAWNAHLTYDTFKQLQAEGVM